MITAVILITFLFPLIYVVFGVVKERHDRNRQLELIQKRLAQKEIEKNNKTLIN